MKYLTFTYKNLEIKETVGDSDPMLKLTTNDKWGQDYLYWFNKLPTQPILKVDNKLYLLWKVNHQQTIFWFLPLRGQYYWVNLELYDNENKTLLFVSPGAKDDEIECTNTDHEDFLCDVCDLCFEHNDGVSYYTRDSHPNTLINYEKKYKVKVDRVCEHCMDDGCIMD